LKYREYAYWAYVAGIIDADGCIMIHRQKAPKKSPMDYYYKLHLAVTQRDGRVIDFLLGFAGGHLTRKQKDGFPLYRWDAYGDEAMRILKKIEPFLRIKKRQSQIAIQFRQYQHRLFKAFGKNGNKPYPSHVIERLGKFYDECSNLKKKYIPPAETKRVDSQLREAIVRTAGN